MSIKEHGPYPQGKNSVVFKHTFCRLCKQCHFIMNEWDKLLKVVVQYSSLFCVGEVWQELMWTLKSGWMSGEWDTGSMNGQERSRGHTVLCWITATVHYN